jgi:hypothetical protein
VPVVLINVRHDVSRSEGTGYLADFLDRTAAEPW